MLELCICGQALKILRLSSLAQTMNAFIGLFTWNRLRASGDMDDDDLDITEQPAEPGFSVRTHADSSEISGTCSAGIALDVSCIEYVSRGTKMLLWGTNSFTATKIRLNVIYIRALDSRHRACGLQHFTLVQNRHHWKQYHAQNAPKRLAIGAPPQTPLKVQDALQIPSRLRRWYPPLFHSHLTSLIHPPKENRVKVGVLTDGGSAHLTCSLMIEIALHAVAATEQKQWRAFATDGTFQKRHFQDRKETRDILDSAYLHVT